MMPEASDSGMDDSIYADDGVEEKPESNPSVDEETAEHPTALVPLSALGGGAKVGDTVTLKVVKVHGEEAEVEIASSHGEPTTKTASTGPEEEPDMDAMMEG